MAAEPKRRHSKARKRTRRASIILESVSLVACKNCGKSILAHIVCPDCGYYKGKSVVKEQVKVTTVK